MGKKNKKSSFKPDEKDVEAGSTGSNNSFAALFASPVIKITVGPAKKQYNLHEGILVQKTGYFASLKSSGLQEAQTSSVELSTEVDREDAFEKFIEYLYEGDYSAPEDIETSCILHARVHTLAERLCFDELKISSAQKLQDSLSKRYREVVGSLFGGSQVACKYVISAATLIQLASIIYTFTPEPLQKRENNIPEVEPTVTSQLDSPESSQPKSCIAGHSDGGNSLAESRQIVSCYAASCWSSLRLDENVKRFMGEHTDFAYDVLFHTSDGPRLRPCKGDPQDEVRYVF